jgi:hypothetical protein
MVWAGNRTLDPCLGGFCETRLGFDLVSVGVGTLWPLEVHTAHRPCSSRGSAPVGAGDENANDFELRNVDSCSMLLRVAGI